MIAYSVATLLGFAPNILAATSMKKTERPQHFPLKGELHAPSQNDYESFIKECVGYLPQRFFSTAVRDGFDMLQSYEIKDLKIYPALDITVNRKKIAKLQHDFSLQYNNDGQNQAYIFQESLTYSYTAKGSDGRSAQQTIRWYSSHYELKPNQPEYFSIYEFFDGLRNPQGILNQDEAFNKTDFQEKLTRAFRPFYQQIQTEIASQTQSKDPKPVSRVIEKGCFDTIAQNIITEQTFQKEIIFTPQSEGSSVLEIKKMHFALNQGNLRFDDCFQTEPYGTLRLI